MNREERVRQRRQQGEILFRQRFEEHGLSERFEFIGRNWEFNGGRLIKVKCKTCGNAFETYSVYEYFRGKVKNVCCPECGMKSDGNICWPKSEACRKALAYYADGHSVLETAERFGVPDYYVTNAAIKAGVSNGKDFHKAGAEASKQNLLKRIATVTKAAELRRQQILDELDLDYIESIGTRANAKVRIRCRVCGHVFERYVAQVYKGRVRCPECVKVDRERQKREREAEKQKEKERRQAAVEQQKAERIRINPLGLSRYQLFVRAKLDVAHVCEICGKEYTIRDRMEKEGLKYCSDNGCCSVVCSRKKARHKQRDAGYPKNHLHRAHRYGCKYDGSVTLKKLIKRDGLRCALCGEMCDPNDHSWTEHHGPMSPTIDHIIPMSKGGGHTWDNVQIAHAICNSRKRDSTDEETEYNAS